jgi:hypothetical protein
MCAWLDELQRGHHWSGEVYFPNRDSDERGQSSGAVRNNRRWQVGRVGVGPSVAKPFASDRP